MSEIQKDIYHQILDFLKDNENIVFNNDIRAGTPFKPWIYDNSILYNSCLYTSDEFEDCEILNYFEVAPKTPIYDIISLKELTNNLLPQLKPIQKIEPEIIEKKNKFLGKNKSLIGTKRTVKPGRLIFKEEYGIPMIDLKTEQQIISPYSTGIIVDIQPNLKFFKRKTPEFVLQERNLDILSTNPWPLK